MNYVKFSDLSPEQLHTALTSKSLINKIKEDTRKTLEDLIEGATDTLQTVRFIDGMAWVDLGYSGVEGFWDTLRLLQHELNLFTEEEFNNMSEAYDTYEGVYDILQNTYDASNLSDVMVDEILDTFEYTVQKGLNNMFDRAKNIGQDFESMYLLYARNGEMFDNFYFDALSGKVYYIEITEL